MHFIYAFCNRNSVKIAGLNLVMWQQLRSFASVYANKDPCSWHCMLVILNSRVKIKWVLKLFVIFALKLILYSILSNRNPQEKFWCKIMQNYHIPSISPCLINLYNARQVIFFQQKMEIHFFLFSFIIMT